jgi:predicted nucleic acid-binding protein
VTVYVETNFLIVLALQQEQCEATERILELAHRGQIDLALPALAILEAVHTAEGWRRRKAELGDQIGKEVDQLRRSRGSSSRTSTLENVIGDLTRIGASQTSEVLKAITQVLSCSRVLDFRPAVFAEALASEQTLGLSVADSIIYASIAMDLRGRQGTDAGCFLSRDRNFVQTVAGQLFRLLLPPHP